MVELHSQNSCVRLQCSVRGANKRSWSAHARFARGVRKMQASEMPSSTHSNSISRPLILALIRWRHEWFASLSKKQPPFPSAALVAATLIVELLYTLLIIFDSFLQSSGSSCIIHNESIQRHRRPSFWQIDTASWNVLQRVPTWNPFRRSWKFRPVSFRERKEPQQWLKVAYGVDGWRVEDRRSVIVSPSKNRSRVGRNFCKGVQTLW